MSSRRTTRLLAFAACISLLFVVSILLKDIPAYLEPENFLAQAPSRQSAESLQAATGADEIDSQAKAEYRFSNAWRKLDFRKIRGERKGRDWSNTWKEYGQHLNKPIYIGPGIAKGLKDGGIVGGQAAVPKAGEIDMYGETMAVPTCDRCQDSDSFCKAIGEPLIQASQIHLGSRLRLHRFFRKLIAGQPVIVSVIGGSVSRGHGLTCSWRREGEGDDDERKCGLNMHRIVFDYINATFPHPEHQFFNDAQGGMGSTYFNMCFGEHVHPDSDLVLIELGINDERQLFQLDSFELLVRGLLDMKNKPAVINMQIFALSFGSMTLGSDLHLSATTAYDVPSISMRNVVLAQTLALPYALEASRQSDIERYKWEDRKDADEAEKEMKMLMDQGRAGGVEMWMSPERQGFDTRHLSRAGHALMGKLVNIFLERELCRMPALQAAYFPEMTARVAGPEDDSEDDDGLTSFDTAEPAGIDGRWSFDHYEGIREEKARGRERKTWKFEGWDENGLQMPRQLINQKFDLTTNVPRLQPMCMSMTSKRNKLTPSANSGWREWNWGDKHYLIADEPGSTVAFKFSVSFGQLRLVYQRSAEYGLGSVDCWIDDDTRHKLRVDGYWDLKGYNIGQSADLGNGISPGEHTLTCELSTDTKDPDGGREFRIISLMGL